MASAPFIAVSTSYPFSERKIICDLNKSISSSTQRTFFLSIFPTFFKIFHHLYSIKLIKKNRLMILTNYWITMFTSRPASLVVVGGILAAPSGSTEERL